MLGVDENDNPVGFIQKKKFHNENKKKHKPAIYGYVTEIDSDCISCKERKAIGDEDNQFYYEFGIKREKDIDHVEINCGKTPRIKIWSKQYGCYMDFSISYDGIFASFKSKTENFNVTEMVLFRHNKCYGEETNYSKEYTYQIKYCDKERDLNDLDNKGIITREISAKYNPHFQKKGQIEITEYTWINNEAKTPIQNTVDGTVEEAIEKHQMGIDAVSRFRYMLNSILPFKQEIMNILPEKTPYLVAPGIELFLPDII